MNWKMFNSGPPEFESIQTIDMDCPNCRKPIRFVCPPKLLNEREEVEFYQKRFIEMAKRYETLLRLIPQSVVPYLSLELERRLREEKGE